MIHATTNTSAGGSLLLSVKSSLASNKCDLSNIFKELDFIDCLCRLSQLDFFSIVWLLHHSIKPIIITITF
jgi:hypothetical protein